MDNSPKFQDKNPDDAAHIVTPPYLVFTRDPDSVSLILDDGSYIDATTRFRRLPCEPDFDLMTPGDLAKLPEPVYLISGLIETGTDSLFYGRDGSGKSLICLDIALSVASGQPWFGRETRQCEVVYIYTEGWGRLKNRKAAWEEHHKRSVEEGIWFRVRPLRLSKPTEVSAFIAKLRKAGVRPGLIIIDTLARNGGGIDVNKDADMALYHEGTRKLREAFGCATITVHHAGKDKRRGAKGATSISDALDGVFEVAKDKAAKQGRIVIEKQRDADAGANIPFRLTAMVGDTGSVTVEPDSGKADSDDRKAATRATASQKRRHALILEKLRSESVGLTYGELHSRTGIPQATLSKDLKALKEAQRVDKNEETGLWSTL
ncbi:AAA family ATPase [Sinorhizobium chiapasense]